MVALKSLDFFFSQMVIGRIKKFKILNLLLIKNMGRGFTFLKIGNKTDHTFKQTMLSRFTNFCVHEPH